MIVRLVRDSTLVTWRAIAKDGMDLPPDQATMRPPMQQMGNGETYDFELHPRHPAISVYGVGGGGGASRFDAAARALGRRAWLHFASDAQDATAPASSSESGRDDQHEASATGGEPKLACTVVTLGTVNQSDQGRRSYRTPTRTPAPNCVEPPSTAMC